MNKLTRKEKQQKAEFLAELIAEAKDGKIKLAKNIEFDNHSVLLCTAIQDGDFKEINRFWDLEANKSYPRDLYCHKCKRQVMISNNLFKAYQEAKIKPKLLCSKCCELFKVDKPVDSVDKLL